MYNETISINGSIYPIVAAITETEQAQGLMWKKHPAPIMIFPYNKAGIRKFWMKNTFIPLDIVFCNKNKIVGFASGEPLSTKLIGPDIESDLVVELPAGMVNTNGLKIGDYISYSLAPKNISKLIIKG